MPPHPLLSLFDDATAWQVFASGQAEGKITASAAGCLRLDYDFHGGSGFIAMRRAMDFTLPDTFTLGLKIRGQGPPNHLEFKVAAPGGQDVWRHQRLDFALPENWMPFSLTERGLLFAWGPSGGGAPSQVSAVEWVIAAGPGGKGFVEFCSPTFADESPRAPAAVTASSHLSGFPPAAVMDPTAGPGWHAAPDDPRPSWTVDFGHLQRFGGLRLDWPENLPPRAYQISLSTDGTTWTTVHDSAATCGPFSHIPIPKATARFLRLTFDNSTCAALRRLTLKPDAFSHSPNDFIHQIAHDYPRGWFPRYWHREQSFWSPIGPPEGRRRALINEEGMVEVDEAGFSLEPFLLTDGKLITWDDVKTHPSLPNNGTPLPSVQWKTNGLTLDIQPWVDGSTDQLTLHVTYRLKSRDLPPGSRICVAARPWQVNPPWQAFRNLGGRSPIHHIQCTADGLAVEGKALHTLPRPDHTGAASFDEGGVLPFLTSGTVPTCQEINDPAGLAAAVMVWDIPSGLSTFDVTVSVPFFERLTAPTSTSRQQQLDRWRRTLGRVQWDVPPCAQPAFAAFRTAAGHILINRDGPAIQPGPRRYTRSWIRDCAIMGAALTKAGLPGPLKEFLTWYAPFQREDGFVPCVVDRDGIDWLVEHDSHGQFLWAVCEVFRTNPDRTFLKAMSPHVRKAADFLITLRATRLTETYRTGPLSDRFGVLPESASHEGYLAHPVHSYWDDFWGIRGLEAAAELADALSFPDDAGRWKTEATAFMADLLASIGKVIENHKLAYIPGSVEWADFDPTATANAIAMLDYADLLPQAPLRTMLATYLDGFRRKHRGEVPWTNYSAYEIRIIGAFVRLGQRDEANELLQFFLSDRRPVEWNQWPEISWRDPRSPGHLGDVPHTWIAAEYLLALTSMVAAERESDESLVLASGMPWIWIAHVKGFSVKALPTRFGLLDFSIHAPDSSTIHLKIAGKLTMPPGGLSVSPPLPHGRRVKAPEVPEATLTEDGKTIRIHTVPLTLSLQLLPASFQPNRQDIAAAP